MKKFIIYLSCLFLLKPCFAADLFEFKNFKNEFNHKKNSSKANLPILNFFLLSNVNLYSEHRSLNADFYKNIYAFSPYDSEYFQSPFSSVQNSQALEIIKKYQIPNPNKDSKNLYDYSQVILQEAIHNILASLKIQDIDFVIYGGNQVYSNDYLDIFDEINLEFSKYNVRTYQIFGENDLRGSKNPDKLSKDRYYLLKSKSTNIIVLDNVSSNPVPKGLPENATDQYLWLSKIIAKLDKAEPLIIIAAKPLNKESIDFINKFESLNLQLLIYTMSGSFAINDKDSSWTLASKPLVIHAPALSTKPCAYLNIKRNSEGRFEIRKQELLSLKSICL